MSSDGADTNAAPHTVHTHTCIIDRSSFIQRSIAEPQSVSALMHELSNSPHIPYLYDLRARAAPAALVRSTHSIESFVSERSPFVSTSTAVYTSWTPLGALYESCRSNHSSSHTASSLPRIRREVDRHKLARTSSARHLVTSSERTWHNIYQSYEVRLHDGSFRGRRHFKSTTGAVEYWHCRCVSLSSLHRLW